MGDISYWITGIVSIIVAALGSSWLGVDGRTYRIITDEYSGLTRIKEVRE